MQHVRIFPIVLAMILVLLPQSAVGQQRRVDLRGQWGYTYLLEDTPPQAWIGGGSVTAAVGPRLRLGVEVLQANMFGQYNNYKSRARLVTPVVEFEFSPGRRFNPYLVIGGGYTQYRTLEPSVPQSRVIFGPPPADFFDPSLPEFEWRKEGSFNLTGGLGVRLFVTKRFFVAPELRVGLIPLLRSTVALGYSF